MVKRPSDVRAGVNISAIISGSLSKAERTIARGHADLQPSHPRLLAYVDTERGSRVNELAKKMGVTRQAVSQMLDDIEAAGCAERRPDPEDARAVRVQVGKDGHLIDKPQVIRIEKS